MFLEQLMQKLHERIWRMSIMIKNSVTDSTCWGPIYEVYPDMETLARVYVQQLNAIRKPVDEFLFDVVLWNIIESRDFVLHVNTLIELGKNGPMFYGLVQGGLESSSWPRTCIQEAERTISRDKHEAHWVFMEKVGHRRESPECIYGTLNIRCFTMDSRYRRQCQGIRFDAGTTAYHGETIIDGNSGVMA